MSLMIAAVPTAGTASGGASALGVTTELQLFEFAGELQRNAAGVLPQVGNPVTLANQAMGGLQGYFERLEKMNSAMPKVIASTDAGDMHGGPARENLDPSGATAASPPSAAGSIASLQQTMNFSLELQSLLVEQNVIVSGTSHVSRSMSSLLRGE